MFVLLFSYSITVDPRDGTDSQLDFATNNNNNNNSKHCITPIPAPSSMDAEASTQEVLVKFVTPFAAYRVPPAPLAVPAELNRNGLSQVIHHLLGIENAGACGCSPAGPAAETGYSGLPRAHPFHFLLTRTRTLNAPFPQARRRCLSSLWRPMWAPPRPLRAPCCAAA